MATQIGVIKALIGEVKATAADGSTRTLQLGDMVYANELITTGPGGAVEIEFADGSIMDLGRSSQAMLDEAVFDPTATAVADASSEDVPDDVAAIQQALLEGEDPTEIGEATAAGAGVTGTGNEGHEPVFVDYLNPEVTPDAGFDTIGVSNEYDLPEEDIIILEEEDEPVVPVVSVSVDVEIEIDEQEPPQTEPPTDGVPTPDYPVLVEGNAASVLEGTSEGTKQVVFIINLSEAFDQDVQVTYQLRPVSTNGAADNPDDWFDGPSIQTVTILAGDTSFPVEVSIVEDHLDEGNGTFEIVLLSANNATINPDADSATVTIYDDDTTPVAQDDLNTVFEDNAGQPYDGDPSTSGNVISGIHDATGDTPDVQEDTDEDGDVLEIVSFSDADENVPAGGTITGEYGELTLNSDGSYTYVLTTNDSDVIQGLSEGEFLSDVFSYVVTDTYNAEQTAELTIVIEGTDDGVIIRGLDGEGAEEAVYEANLADGSDPDAPALTQDGSFDFDAPDGIGDTGSVSIGGQSFSLAQLQALGGANVDIPSSYGVLTLTGYTGDAFGGSISYEYTLNDNVDNDSQAGATDGSFTDSFEVIVTDNDGSDATASLDVEIIDDTPTANDDGPEAVTEDGTSVVSGNVLDNDDANADQVAAFVGWGDDQDNVDAIAALNTYGTLVQNGDGSWSYTLDNTDPDTQALDSSFSEDYVLTYTMADADGDEAPASLTITINGADDNASVVTAAAQGPDATVYEAGLNPDGSDAGSDSETTTGSFTVSATDGILNVVIGGTTFTLAEVQAFDGTQTVSTGEGTLTLTDYTGDAMSGTINYSYTLDATIDNDSVVASGDDAVTLAHFDDSTEITVNGVGGSTASDDLVIRAIDDTPTANDDGPEAVTEDGTSVVSGNVLDNDDANADQVAAFVGWGDDQDNVDAIAALNTYGTLVQNGDGSWSYTLDNTDPDTQALDSSFSEDYVLTYTMADADGDEAPASLTITINGADDNASVVTAAAQGPDATVYEAGLNPDGSDAGSDSETTTGSFTVSATDGILNVVIGGTTFTLAEVQAFDGTQTVSTGEGTLTLTDYTGDAMSGTINYSYTLDATIDNDSVVASGDDAVTLAHFDDSTEITVNGVGGSTASDDLVIRAIDDTPTANDDGPVATAEDTAVDVTVDVNDVAGADGVDFTDGTKVFVSTAASNGSVIYNDDGTFTYTPDAGFEGQDTFVYTITDNDGDTDTATVTITVGPDSEPVVSVSDAAVDETGGLDSVDGTLSADFGNDTGAIALSATGATWSAGTNTLTANDGSWKVVNNQNGTYTFTQLAAMSHLGGEDASLDIVVTVTATDSDGDVDNTNTITVTVYDDGPVVTDYDGVINTDAASGLEVLDYDLGLDGLGSVSFSLAGSSVPLTSGGQAVLTESIDLGDGREQLVGYLESGDNAGYQEGEDGVVFSIAPQSPDADPTDGTYELTLSSDNVLDLPQTTVSVSFSGISASGPIDSIDTTGGEITISVISGREGPDDVNANSNYVGINNNGMDDGESIQYLFNTTLVNDLQLDIFNTGGAGETVTWTTWNSADKAGTIDDGSIIITGDGLSVPITADDDFDVIQITVTGGSFKVGGVTYTDTGDPQDVLVQFDYQGQDSDGDAVNGSVDVTVTGIDATTQTSSDLLSHPDSQVDPS